MFKAYFNPKILGLIAVIMFTLSSAAAVVTPGSELTVEPQQDELHSMLYVMPDSSIEYFIHAVDMPSELDAAIEVEIP